MIKKLKILAASIFLILIPSLPFAEEYEKSEDGFVALRNNDGQEIEAKVLDFRGGKAKVQLRNGRTINADASIFDEKSVAIMKAEMAPRCVVRIKLDQKVSLKSKYTKITWDDNDHRKDTARAKTFTVVVDTTSPYEREVVLKWVILAGENITMDKDEGIVGYGNKIEKEIVATAESSSIKIVYYGFRPDVKRKYGNDKVEIAVFAFDKNNNLLDSKSTSKNFEDDIKSNFEQIVNL